MFEFDEYQLSVTANGFNGHWVFVYVTVASQTVPPHTATETRLSPPEIDISDGQ